VLLLALVCAALPANASAVSVEVTGPEETVYDFDTMACFWDNAPDGTARAFRDAGGRIQVWIRGHDTRMVGPDLNNLTHDCTQVMLDTLSPNPWDYDYADWIAAPWTEDGETVYALVHAEYHGWRLPGWCPGEPFQKCRYNSVTFAKSTNRGDSFQNIPGADSLVAAMPYRYVPGDGRYGYFSPSSIVEKDGWFYSLLLVSTTYRDQRAGSCLMRTRNVADPKSWRAWDGDGFNVRFIDPYRESPEPVHRHVCEPVSYDRIRDMNRSLTYNSFLDKFVVTGVSNKYDPDLGRKVYGLFYSTSDDLIEWTDREVLLETETLGTYQCGDANPRAYPGILDPDATDRNFSTTDQNAYLYFTDLVANNCVIGAERDMIRVPIRFLP